MLRKNLVPVWIGILVLAGFIMGAAGGCPMAPVPKTGQTTSYAVGDDGALQKGVASPSQRFTDNGNGTVTDNLTGLIWTKAADCDLFVGWNEALSYCNGLAAGTCGLTDGSAAGAWRLPNVRELQSLIDYGNYGPALPTGHPFTNVKSPWYWSSTTVASSTGGAWGVTLGGGEVLNGGDKGNTDGLAWCVRGGQ